MEQKLGIIAGSGRFPLYICRRIRSEGKTCIVAAVSGEAEEILSEEADIFHEFSLDNLNALTGFLKKHRIKQVILAGKIEPRRTFEKSPPRGLIFKMLQKGKDQRPASLVSLAISFLNRSGFEVMDPSPYLSDTFCPKGRLNGIRIKKRVSDDIEFGWPLARKLADWDIGQTLVVKKQAVAAVEGMEGTNAAIRRGGELAGPGTVVIKISRSSQDPRIDLPAVGMETVKICLEAGCAALCIEAGTMPFFQKEEALERAQKHGLAVLAK